MLHAISLSFFICCMPKYLYDSHVCIYFSFTIILVHLHVARLSFSQTHRLSSHDPQTLACLRSSFSRTNFPIACPTLNFPQMFLFCKWHMLFLSHPFMHHGSCTSFLCLDHPSYKLPLYALICSSYRMHSCPTFSFMLRYRTIACPSFSKIGAISFVRVLSSFSQLVSFFV